MNTTIMILVKLITNIKKPIQLLHIMDLLLILAQAVIPYIMISYLSHSIMKELLVKMYNMLGLNMYYKLLKQNIQS